MRRIMLITLMVMISLATLALPVSTTFVPTGECGTKVDCRNCQGQCEEWGLDHYSACMATGNSGDYCWDSHNKFKYQCGNTYCPNCGWIQTYYYVP